MILPDRISGLIQQIEAGNPVTRADVDRVARLQALDIAKAGEDFAREAIARAEEGIAFMARGVEP